MRYIIDKTITGDGLKVAQYERRFSGGKCREAHFRRLSGLEIGDVRWLNLSVDL